MNLSLTIFFENWLDGFSFVKFLCALNISGKDLTFQTTVTQEPQYKKKNKIRLHSMQSKGFYSVNCFACKRGYLLF